jgi:hypothetical protein
MPEYRVRVHPSGSWQIFNQEGPGWTSGMAAGRVPVDDNQFINMPNEPGDYTLESHPWPAYVYTPKSEPDLILGIVWSSLEQCQAEYDLRVGGHIETNPDADFEIHLIDEKAGVIEAWPDGRHGGKLYRVAIVEDGGVHVTLTYDEIQAIIVGLDGRSCEDSIADQLFFSDPSIPWSHSASEDLIAKLLAARNPIAVPDLGALEV